MRLFALLALLGAGLLPRPALAQAPGPAPALFPSLDEAPEPAATRHRWDGTLLSVQLSVGVGLAVLGGGAAFFHGMLRSLGDGPFWRPFLAAFVIFQAIVPPLTTWLVGKALRGGGSFAWTAVGSLAALALTVPILYGAPTLLRMESFTTMMLVTIFASILCGTAPVIAYQLSSPREPEATKRKLALRAIRTTHLRGRRAPPTVPLLAFSF